MPLPTIWTKHLGNDKEAKERLEQLLRNSGISLGRLRDILKEEKDKLLSGSWSVKTYDSPNWQYQIADTNGCLRTLDNVLRLLDFLDETNERKTK